MKDHEESEFEESGIKSGKEMGFAAAMVESDTKQPGERHGTYSHTMALARYIQTRSHTHLICASHAKSMFIVCAVTHV